MLNVSMLSVALLNVIILNTIKLKAVMLSVVAPFLGLAFKKNEKQVACAIKHFTAVNCASAQ